MSTKNVMYVYIQIRVIFLYLTVLKELPSSQERLEGELGQKSD